MDFDHRAVAVAGFTEPGLGILQPVAGALSDRHGAGRVIAVGGVLYALGLYVAVSFSEPMMIMLGAGILIGLAQSCTTFSVVLGVISRRVSEQRRPMALGIASAGGSFGQMSIIPMAQGLMEFGGSEFSLLCLAALACIVVPLAVPMAGKATEETAGGAPGPQEALLNVIKGAATHKGYILLTLGFFTCGFQIAFITVHLPVYLLNCGLPVHVNPANLAATALATVGFFNMIGTYMHGALGGRYRMKNLWRSTMCCVVSSLWHSSWRRRRRSLFSLFSAGMGLLWLGTVPLTSGVVAKIFGPENLGMLFGLCFLSHQIGSFLGVYIGGAVFDLTGNYDLIWILTALAGFMAAAFNFPIEERPVAKPA